MKGFSADPCGSCAEHREQSLVRLGLSPEKWDYLIALAGNPNVGKSTVFNQLTGLRQHTGNWPGKTVVRAEGVFAHESHRVKVVDLPGTYSLQAGSVDEEVARDFVLFGRPDVTLIVVDATRRLGYRSVGTFEFLFEDRVSLSGFLVIEHTNLFGQTQRMIKGQGIDHGPEAKLFGALGNGRQKQVRRRRHTQWRRVMFGHVITVKTGRVISLDQLEAVVIKLVRGKISAVHVVENTDIDWHD